jgi:hypothetical protein
MENFKPMVRYAFARRSILSAARFVPPSRTGGLRRGPSRDQCMRMIRRSCYRQADSDLPGIAICLEMETTANQLLAAIGFGIALVGIMSAARARVDAIRINAGGPAY